MISIIIPTFNRASSISNAIDSVLNQTYTEWELLIVDDGSTDNTEELILKYMIKCSKIKYIKKANGGSASARNTGIKNALGEYLAFLDSDDIWYPFHLEECIEAINSTKYKFISALWDIQAYGTHVKIGESGFFNDMFNNMEKDLGIKRNNKYWKFDNRLLIYVLMNNFYCFHINTVVVSKDIVEEIGGFDEKLTASEDLDFIYRIMLKNNLLTINNQHFQYNYGDDNIYAFCDRYNQSFEKDILNNPKYVLRISKNICCKIRLHEKMKKIVKNELMFLEYKKQLIDTIDNLIYRRLRSLCVINKKFSKRYCAWATFRSIFYLKYANFEQGLLWPRNKYWKNNLLLD